MVNPPALATEPKALIRSGVTLTSTQTFNVDIQAITLTGRITVNGVVLPAERFGTVTLRNSTTGDSVALGMLTDASYTPKQIISRSVRRVLCVGHDGHGESSGAAAESASQPGMRKHSALITPDITARDRKGGAAQTACRKQRIVWNVADTLPAEPTVKPRRRCPSRRIQHEERLVSLARFFFYRADQRFPTPRRRAMRWILHLATSARCGWLSGM